MKIVALVHVLAIFWYGFLRLDLMMDAWRQMVNEAPLRGNFIDLHRYARRERRRAITGTIFAVALTILFKVLLEIGAYQL